MRTFTTLLSILLATLAAADEISSGPQCSPLPATTLPAAPPAAPVSRNACANGDFESGLEPSEWYGQHGGVYGPKAAVLKRGTPFFSVPGLIGGNLASCDAHQTVVTAADLDPNAPIRFASNAVRIGNSAANARADMLAKTFVVEATQSVITFSYAVVLQDPQHVPYEEQQPSFEVRVVDACGKPVNATVDLGNGSGKLIADRNNPFFTFIPGTLTVYRDWTCARIDLSGHVGERLTVQFITEDCARGAHFGYAYIDELCNGGSCAPNVTLAENASVCGAGQICFRYTKAQAVDPAPSAKLEIVNGPTLIDPVVTAETICFRIDPATITAGAAFDYSAVVTFRTGNGTIERRVGSATEGVVPGPNNDYSVSCGCCRAVNLIANGDFERGDTAFASEFSRATTGRVLPGEYAVLNAIEARAISPTWIAQSHSTCTDSGRFLAINGETCGGGSRTIWSQRVAVEPDTDYRFCVNARNLPQRGFDVVPRIELRFSSPLATTVHTVDVGGEPCDWLLISRKLHVPAGVTSLTCEIRLLDDGRGDGNDLALDDVSLQKLALPAGVPDLTASTITAGTYILSTPALGSWTICENGGECVSIRGELSAFVFDVLKAYTIAFAADDACTLPGLNAWEVRADGVGISIRHVPPP